MFLMQAVIIGAGIVGLHIANLLCDKGHEVYVLDKAPYFAEHTSGRNSGVIHAGIFYQTGSFKEHLCLEGNRLTHEWVKKLAVAHDSCGKWVVPEPGQEDDLEPFYERLCALDMPRPEILTASEVKKREPHLRELPAILVPSTGILDAAAYVKALAVFVEQKGVSVILNCEVFEVNGNMLRTSRGEIPFDLAVNSAGLWADVILGMTGVNGYEIRPCRGDYYMISSAPLRRPVYHLPYKNEHGLGVHLTPTLDGQTLIGPNAFFIEEKSNYQHHSDITAYWNSLAFYLPAYDVGQIQPAYSGNRPKLYKDGKAVSEFTIFKHHNWIHLLGIESPGLTSAPVLARHVANLL